MDSGSSWESVGARLMDTDGLMDRIQWFCSPCPRWEPYNCLLRLSGQDIFFHPLQQKFGGPKWNPKNGANVSGSRLPPNHTTQFETHPTGSSADHTPRWAPLEETYFFLPWFTCHGHDLTDLPPGLTSTIFQLPSVTFTEWQMCGIAAYDGGLLWASLLSNQGGDGGLMAPWPGCEGRALSLTVATERLLL